MPESLEKSVVRLSRCCDRVRRAEGPVQSHDHPPVQFPPEPCQSSQITQPSQACASHQVTEHSQISHTVSPSYWSPYLNQCYKPDQCISADLLQGLNIKPVAWGSTHLVYIWAHQTWVWFWIEHDFYQNWMLISEVTVCDICWIYFTLLWFKSHKKACHKCEHQIYSTFFIVLINYYFF